MTRIWMITPSLMCNNHLRGQWKELFQLVGAIKKGMNLRGYLEKRQITTKFINLYALEVREAMMMRGFKCKKWKVYDGEVFGKVDLSFNLLDLCERCPECKKRILGVLK